MSLRTRLLAAFAYVLVLVMVALLVPLALNLSRRVDANWLGGLVARHVVEMDEARSMARSLAYELARQTYNFAPSDAAVTAGSNGTPALAGASACVWLLPPAGRNSPAC